LPIAASTALGCGRWRINALPDELLGWVLVRSDQETVLINLEIEPAEPPEEVRWIDPDNRDV
jgi:hypothetical protein